MDEKIMKLLKQKIDEATPKEIDEALNFFNMVDNIRKQAKKKVFDTLWKKAYFYDKLSKKMIKRKVALDRLECGLKHTFHIVIQSEDWSKENQKNKRRRR